jgi:hypothetical protein
MPANPAYMNFVLTKYLGWHRKNFSFPDESETLRTLVSKLDNWIIETPYLRQLTLNHFANEKGIVGYRIRVYVHPSLRNMTAWKGKGLPAKELMFVEWDNTGSLCQIFRESKNSFSSWCRKKENASYTLSWTEKIERKLPPDWKLPFPVLGEAFIEKEVNGEITEILFFEVSPHPSLIPKSLVRSVFLHTKEGLLPLDRVSNDRNGGIGIHYP